jgi:Tol biopolymer transport system component
MRQRNVVWGLTVALALACGGAAAALQQKATTPDAILGEALHQEEAAGNLEAAIDGYKKVIGDKSAGRQLVATALLHMGMSYAKLGHKDARATLERVTRDYGDQAQIAAQARTQLAAFGSAKVDDDTRVVARQLWVGDEVDPFGSPSPDGRLYAYFDWTSGPVGNLALRDLTTGERRQLTHAATADAGFGGYPAVSPDGTQIAYSWEAGGTSGTSVRLIGVDGSRPRVLFYKPGTILYALRWSPNGRQIAAAMGDIGGDQTWQIALISVSDGTVTRLKSTGWQAPDVGGYSADGRYLTYAIGENPGRGIFAIATDGSRETPLVQGAAQSFAPIWTPESDGIAFLSTRSGSLGLWWIRVSDGKPQGEPTLLRADIGRVANMGFLRDGSYFYGTTNSKADVFTCEIDPDTLQVASLPRRLSDDFIGANSGPAWSPDGRTVAFFRGPNPTAMSLVIRTIADGTERTLPTKLTNSVLAGREGPVWMPDGRSLLVPDVDYAMARAMIRKVDVASGAEHVVLEARDIWPHLRVSADGKSVFFTRKEQGTTPDLNDLRLVKRDLDGGQETELYRQESNAVGFFSLAVSPDGTQITFMANRVGERTLMTVPTAGGPSRVLYRGVYERPLPFGAVWARNGRDILAMATDGRGARVWAFPADGSAPRKLDVRMQEILALGQSPDGRRLVFTGAQSKGEVWTIRNLLPQSPAATPSSR